MGMMEKVFQTVPQKELYDETGIQMARLNTIFQLYSLVQNEPETLGSGGYHAAHARFVRLSADRGEAGGIHRGIHHADA